MTEITSQHAFDQAMQLQVLTDNRFSGHTSEAYANMVGPFGGATAAVLLVLRPHLRIDGPGFTSVFQGGIRFNNYIGLAASAALHGAPGVALAAVANAAIVPTVNVLSVLAFARFGKAKPSLAGTLKALATNPLILGCLIGALWQATAAPVPSAAPW